MSHAARTRRPSRRWMFRAIAVGVGVLPLLLVELALSLFGLGEPGTAADPLAGFSRVHRLFERVADSDEYRTSPSRGLFFGEQRFAVSKPDDGFRVFCLGGSTVRGRPFTTETSFTRWLELELAGRVPGRTFESVNCGGLSYASYRLLPILHEVLAYEPDLVVVATGHNEFLEDRSYRDIKSRSAVAAWIEDQALSLRTVTLVRSAFQPKNGDREDQPGESLEVEARLDELSGYASYHRDDRWRKSVVAQYEDSLRKMVAACKVARVPLVLVRLGSNLRDCPPFKSEHGSDFSPEVEAVWQRAFDDAAEDEHEGRFAEALAAYRRAEEHDDEFALLFWRMARVLDRLGRFDEAGVAYRRARDLDICPLRMIGELDQRLVRVAGDTKTVLVDAAAAGEAASREGIPGYDWFMDHVHPTIFGHQQIAGLIVEDLDRAGLLPGSPNSGHGRGGKTGKATEKTAPDATASSGQFRRRMRRRRHLRLQGPAFFANGARRVEWLETWAQRHRLDEEVRPVDWPGHARAGFRLIDFDQRSAAWDRYFTAINLAPEPERAARVTLEHAGRLFRQGRTAAAKFLLVKMAELSTLDETTLPASLALASLVVAVEEGDRTWAAELLVRYGAGWESDPLTVPGWNETIPAALAKARRPPSTVSPGTPVPD